MTTKMHDDGGSVASSLVSIDPEAEAFAALVSSIRSICERKGIEDADDPRLARMVDGYRDAGYSLLTARSIFPADREAPAAPASTAANRDDDDDDDDAPAAATATDDGGGGGGGADRSLRSRFSLSRRGKKEGGGGDAAAVAVAVAAAADAPHDDDDDDDDSAVRASGPTHPRDGNRPAHPRDGGGDEEGAEDSLFGGPLSLVSGGPVYGGKVERLPEEEEEDDDDENGTEDKGGRGVDGGGGGTRAAGGATGAIDCDENDEHEDYYDGGGGSPPPASSSPSVPERGGSSSCWSSFKSKCGEGGGFNLLTYALLLTSFLVLVLVSSVISTYLSYNQVDYRDWALAGGGEF